MFYKTLSCRFAIPTRTKLTHWDSGLIWDIASIAAVLIFNHYKSNLLQFSECSFLAMLLLLKMHKNLFRKINYSLDSESMSFCSTAFQKLFIYAGMCECEGGV